MIFCTLTVKVVYWVITPAFARILFNSLMKTRKSAQKNNEITQTLSYFALSLYYKKPILLKEQTLPPSLPS